MATINRGSNQSEPRKVISFYRRSFSLCKVVDFSIQRRGLFCLNWCVGILSDRYMGKGRVKEKMSRSICGTKKAIFECYDEFQ